MQQSFKKIGILGGTFNPIHCGHLIMAETIRESFDLDKVLFIPSGQPPHKSDHIIEDAESRYEMVQRAVASNRFFEASRIEIDREGFTYTIDTLKMLKKEYGSKTKLFFIIGSDVIPELKTWKEHNEVFKMCDFIVTVRPGCDDETVEADFKQVKDDYEINIIMTESPRIDISSSSIRERLQNGETIKYLVPENVEHYIYTKGLYRKKNE